MYTSSKFNSCQMVWCCNLCILSLKLNFWRYTFNKEFDEKYTSHYNIDFLNQFYSIPNIKLLRIPFNCFQCLLQYIKVRYAENLRRRNFGHFPFNRIHVGSTRVGISDGTNSPFPSRSTFRFVTCFLYQIFTYFTD